MLFFTFQNEGAVASLRKDVQMSCCIVIGSEGMKLRKWKKFTALSTEYVRSKASQEIETEYIRVRMNVLFMLQIFVHNYV